jgi:TolB-like protein
MFRTLARVIAASLPLLALPAAAQPKVRVAVLPVVVHALERQDYLQSGISDMLSTRLEQNPGLSVIRIADPKQATTDPKAAREAAQAAGAEYAVFGSFTRFGDGASLDLRCLSTTAGAKDEPRGVFVQAGSIGEIIPRLDDVADRVGRYALAGAPGVPAVSAGPPGAADAGGSFQDALSELDELRARVERLEAALYGREGGGAPAKPPGGEQP